MKEKSLQNPFPTLGYHGSDYFCDRKEETQQLLRNLVNGSSTTIIAIRRIGKTGLILHALSNLPKGWKGVYIDILATENLNDFLNALASSIIQAVPQKSGIGRRFWEFIQSLRPIISFDTLTGAPQASFNISPKEIEVNIKSVLQFLDNQEFKTVIAIDEFQQILNYPEQNIDAWLRGTIQHLKNVVFIFSGSQQHIMTEMFTSPSRPFFRSTQFIKLGKIEESIYADYVKINFSKYGKQIDLELAKGIIQWCSRHTYYVQLLFNRIFSATNTNVTVEIWHQQADQLLKEQEAIFISYRSLLTSSQWKLLKAIALKGEVFTPTSKDFISKYQLGSSAALLRSLNSLRKYELVYSDFDPNGKSYYCVYDVLFQQWCKEKGF